MFLPLICFPAKKSSIYFIACYRCDLLLSQFVFYVDK